MKIYATVRHVPQIGPYEWEEEVRVKTVTEDTTVGEIITWRNRVTRAAKNHEPQGLMFSVTVEPETE